jgi:hypothetical protein
MKNLTQSSGQNSQLVRWGVLVRRGPMLLLVRPGKAWKSVGIPIQFTNQIITRAIRQIWWERKIDIFNFFLKSIIKRFLKDIAQHFPFSIRHES